MSFEGLYNFYNGFLPVGWDWVAFALAGFTLAFTVINAVIMTLAFYTWFERRALGRFQSRLGPNRWGPFGLLTPFADLIKTMTKEDIVPDTADRPVFTLAPIVLLVPAFLVVAVLPFGDNSFLGQLNIAVLFVIGVTGINTFAVLMAGWGSRNKFAMFGAMRGAAMLISYEVPMALSLAGVVILAGSMSLTDIVNAQALPFFLVQPLAFLVFLTADSAEMNRAPFDMVEAESELTGGYHTEYSGVKWAIFTQAEFTAPLVSAALATVLFLGGAKDLGPIPGQLMFLAKTSLVVFVLVWFRATWPRLRVDQIMAFAWKGLFPLALLNMFLVAVEVFLFQNSAGEISTDSLWKMAGINWAATAVSIVVIANVLGQPRLKRPVPVPSPLANMSAEAD